ncbi:hypothetical protein Tdes44962_MAKER05584 [Teratosphaeria destructans]|uniref:Uncharacterized protein n=1 Tax=Teratosphaeria destructans TaxID=418781 RepID=A0A9W7SJJ9_9PEZI|nr:hypothetical protein Tdes44962_MAKER05584 [Teratosphaeria destructans]
MTSSNHKESGGTTSSRNDGSAGASGGAEGASSTDSAPSNTSTNGNVANTSAKRAPAEAEIGTAEEREQLNLSGNVARAKRGYPIT